MSDPDDTISDSQVLVTRIHFLLAQLDQLPRHTLEYTQLFAELHELSRRYSALTDASLATTRDNLRP